MICMVCGGMGLAGNAVIEGGVVAMHGFPGEE